MQSFAPKHVYVDLSTSGSSTVISTGSIIVYGMFISNCDTSAVSNTSITSADGSVVYFDEFDLNAGGGTTFLWKSSFQVKTPFLADKGLAVTIGTVSGSGDFHISVFFSNTGV